jgi:sugar transferase EpsL
MRYVARYDAFQARRMEVKPGVTGWAQINGRNTLTWEEKFTLDVWYVDHRSFWLDMRIVVRTFFKVFARTGIDEVMVTGMVFDLEDRIRSLEITAEAMAGL